MAETKGESKADKDRRQALELALSQIERQFGKGAVMKLGRERARSRRRRSSRPAPSPSTWRSASAGFRAGASRRSTGRNPPGRPRSPST